MITLNNKTLCENCFSEINNEPCPHCGFLKSAYRPDPIALAQGSVLNQRYMIGGVIGKGGFGITYLAYDLKLDARVAVKEYYPMGIALRNPGTTTVTVSSRETEKSFRTGAEKFYNEAKMVAKFNGNPNIVSVHDFFYENDTVYFIMGYLQGQTLKSYIKTKKITEGQAVNIFDQISNALLAPHGMNILHRDISPDNIMLCDDKTIRLLDFGAARQVVAEQSQSLSVILKQGFAPLEQYQQKGNQGPWTDIYALGATIYTALTGEMLTDPMSRLEDDSDYAGNKFYISENLWNIIYKCTRLKIQDRYQNIEELRADLMSVGIEEEKFTDIEEEITDCLRGEGPEGGELGSNDIAGAYTSSNEADPNATVYLGPDNNPGGSSNETVALSPSEALDYTGPELAKPQSAGTPMPQPVPNAPVNGRPVPQQVPNAPVNGRPVPQPVPNAQVNGRPVPNRQASVRPAPANRTGSTGVPPKKKGLHPVILVLIIVVIIIFLGLVFLYILGSSVEDTEATEAVEVSEEASETEIIDYSESESDGSVDEEYYEDELDYSSMTKAEILSSIRDGLTIGYAGASKTESVYFVADSQITYGALLIIDNNTGETTELVGDFTDNGNMSLTITDDKTNESITVDVETKDDGKGNEYVLLTAPNGAEAVLYRVDSNAVINEILKY